MAKAIVATTVLSGRAAQYRSDRIPSAPRAFKVKRRGKRKHVAPATLGIRTQEYSGAVSASTGGWWFARQSRGAASK